MRQAFDDAVHGLAVACGSLEVSTCDASPDLHRSTSRLLCDTAAITFALAETSTSALCVSSISTRGAAGACFPMTRSQCVTSLSSAQHTVTLPLVYSSQAEIDMSMSANVTHRT